MAKQSTRMAARLTLLAATTLLTTTVTATDPDCTAGYSGYALKIGSACSQYVQCSNGSISAWMTCANGLLYTGDVGMGGICDWSGNVECKDPDLLTEESGEEGALGAVMNGMAVGGAGGIGNLGGGNVGGQQSQQQQQSQQSQSQTDSNPQKYFCGTSETNAAEICVPCPTGKMSECGGDFTHGCFRGVQGCPTTMTASSNTQGGMNSGGNNNNGMNDLVNGAMSINEAIGNTLSNNMDSIVGSFQQAMQATTNNNNNQQQQQQQANQPIMDAVQQQQQQQVGGTTTTTQNSIPAPEPTLPPWTNAPFAPSPPMSKTVIGYYAGWQWYDRNKFADPNNIDFSKYDRINYAFFQPDTNGKLFGTDSWGDPQVLWGPYIYNANQQTQENYKCSWDGPTEKNCAHHDLSRGLIARAQAAGTEVMPSIGGWTLSDNFPGIAADPYKRDHFAEQCVELIEAYGFDGIDLDWEYPGYADHSGTPEDTINFTLLLRAMRTKLDLLGNRKGRYYGLTAALPCGPDKIDKIQVSQIANILDELNLMSYDLHGAFDALTGVNAPMYDQGWTDPTPRWSVHGCVNNYVELGVPLNRMNIGLPFYGRSFQGATGMKQFHGGADDINYHLDEGSPQYFNIVNELKRMTTWRHEKTQTQYAVFNQGGGLVSYDDPRAICDKVGYANERGMHGFLIWEISGDMLDNGSTPLIDTTNNKIQNPNLDCSTLRDPTWALNDGQYRYAPDEPASVDWNQYNGPMSTGSVNDFNGAGENRPLLDGNWNMNDNAMVFQSTDRSSTNNDNNDCPLDFTGQFATPGCKGYVYCQNGQVTGGHLPCVPGTLFDISIGVCTWEDQVTCGN